MPLSKTTGKTRGGGQGGTHAHYAGEFGTSPRHKLGAQEQTSALAKNPEYRAARAEHFAHVARRANEEHAKAHSEGRHADASSHALASAHASHMASKHAKAAQQLASGTDHERAARSAAIDAKNHHADVEHRSGGAPHQSQERTKSIADDRASNTLKTTAFKSSQDASATSVTAHSAGTMASHHDAADAHERAAKAHAEAGDHAQAARHEAHRQNHLRAALDVNHAETVKAMHERESHPDVIRARHLTGKAEAASARAEKSGDKADHDAAALAHGNAVAASRTIGEKGMIRGHVRAADEHAEKGSGRAAHDKSAEASTKARDLSYMIDEGHSKDHGGAEKLHRAAAQSAAAVGAHDVAREHTQKADEHAKHGAGASKPATTLSTRANQVSAIAKVAPSAAAHADAAGAHHNAAAAMNRAGLQGQAAQHAAKATEHQKAAEGAMAGHANYGETRHDASQKGREASRISGRVGSTTSHQSAAEAHWQAHIAYKSLGHKGADKAAHHLREYEIHHEAHIKREG